MRRLDHLNPHQARAVRLFLRDNYGLTLDQAYERCRAQFAYQVLRSRLQHEAKQIGYEFKEKPDVYQPE